MDDDDPARYSSLRKTGNTYGTSDEKPQDESRVSDRWEDSSGDLHRGFCKYGARMDPMWDLVLDYAPPFAGLAEFLPG